jgi:SAM-dependent methyltransferase
MDERLKLNLDCWNEMVYVHANSRGYRLDEFRKGGIHLYPIEREEVGDVQGKSLLHLQCHFGLDTLSWARLGATVTGLDFSDQAIKLARSLSTELKIPATFVCSNIYDSLTALEGEFEVVFTSYGALCWLPDLTRWAQTVAHFVKPGGVFYIAEFHPMTQILRGGGGVHTEPDLSVLEFESSYFSTSMREFPPGPDYSDGSVRLTHGSHEWMYRTGDVVNALINAGLRIEFVREHSVCCFQMFPFMEKGADGWWRIKGDPIPLTLSIRAGKPSR